MLKITCFFLALLYKALRWIVLVRFSRLKVGGGLFACLDGGVGGGRVTILSYNLFKRIYY